MKAIIRTVGSMTCLAAAIAFATATAQAQNLLVDPSFEAATFGQPNPIPVPGGVGGGWAAFQGNLTVAAAHTGVQSATLWDNSWNPSGVYQIVNATAGLNYGASAWFENLGAASGWGTPYLLNLEFHDALGGQVGTTVSTGWLSDLPLGAWQQLSAAGVAPAGTAYAYVYFMAMNSVPTGAAFYVDDASLTVIPEPSSFALVGLGLMSGLIWRRRQ
jgi:hypothetical protein